MTHDSNPLDRRRLLAGGAALLGASCLLPRRAQAWFGDGADATPRTLLLLELNGGNDGLDTIVPFDDDGYHAPRQRVGIPKRDALRFDDYRAFHPNLQHMRKLWDSGLLAIVEGAGYPKPNHSHFTSLDIWHTAQASGRASGDGWIGKLMARLYPEDRVRPHGVHVGQALPYSLVSSTHPIVCFDAPPAYRWAENARGIVENSLCDEAKQMQNEQSRLAAIRGIAANANVSSTEVRRAAAGYAPRVEYPQSDIGQDLRTAAALLSSGIGVRVMSVAQYGYDTHENQRYRHDLLLRELDQALHAFLEDMRGTAAGDNVLVLAYSEFGRRVPDNASNGTDHGTAGPMFLTGTKVQGGLYGKHPSLTDLIEGDLIHTTDFRTVYAAVLERWFGVESEPILGARHEPLKGVIA
jgi:uncharacterized protein (DUF1501 family)